MKVVKNLRRWDMPDRNQCQFACVNDSVWSFRTRCANCAKSVKISACYYHANRKVAECNWIEWMTVCGRCALIDAAPIAVWK